MTIGLPFASTPGHDTDMAAAAPSHHRDRADLRARQARAVVQIAAGEVAAAAMAGIAQHLVHEGTAPEAAPAGRISAKVTAGIRIVQNVYFKDVLKKAEVAIKKGDLMSTVFEANSKYYPIFFAEMLRRRRDRQDRGHARQCIKLL